MSIKNGYKAIVTVATIFAMSMVTFSASAMTVVIVGGRAFKCTNSCIVSEGAGGSIIIDDCCGGDVIPLDVHEK